MGKKEAYNNPVYKAGYENFISYYREQDESFHRLPSYDQYRRAKDAGVITQEQFDLAKEVHGDNWFYVGD